MSSSCSCYKMLAGGGGVESLFKETSSQQLIISEVRVLQTVLQSCSLHCYFFSQSTRTRTFSARSDLLLLPSDLLPPRSDLLLPRSGLLLPRSDLLLLRSDLLLPRSGSTPSRNQKFIHVSRNYCFNSREFHIYSRDRLI